MRNDLKWIKNINLQENLWFWRRKIIEPLALSLKEGIKCAQKIKKNKKSECFNINNVGTTSYERCVRTGWDMEFSPHLCIDKKKTLISYGSNRRFWRVPVTLKFDHGRRQRWWIGNSLQFPWSILDLSHRSINYSPFFLIYFWNLIKNISVIRPQARISRHAAHATKALRWRIEQL